MVKPFTYPSLIYVIVTGSDFYPVGNPTQNYLRPIFCHLNKELKSFRRQKIQRR